MMLKNFFPAGVLLRPARTFGEIGRASWGWPLALYALSLAGAALQLALLPPQFIETSFEGVILTPDRGFLFYFLTALPAGFIFSAFACAVLSAFAGFLRAGRLSLRLPAAAALVAAYGIISAAARGPGAARAAGLAAVAAGAVFAAWGAWRHRRSYPGLLKSLLAISALAVAGDILSGLAALAGSVAFYSGLQYLFALLSLIWLRHAVSAVCDIPGARAMSASVLALLASAAVLFALFNLGLLPQEVFQIMLLI